MNVRKARLVLLTVAVALALAGCGEPGEWDDSPGHSEYQRACAVCHGRDGEGRPPTFPPLAGSEWLEMGPESVALVVLLGLRGEIEVAGRTYRGYMPHMRQLPDADIAAILGYVDQRWAGWEQRLTIDDIAALRAFAADRATPESRADLEAALAEWSQ